MRLFTCRSVRDPRQRLLRHPGACCDEVRFVEQREPRCRRFQCGGFVDALGGLFGSAARTATAATIKSARRETAAGRFMYFPLQGNRIDIALDSRRFVLRIADRSPVRGR